MKSPKPTEKEIMESIKMALNLRNWYVIRMPPSIYSKKGIPDLYAIRNGISVWIEVKRPGGKPSKEQREFGRIIDEGGGIFIVAKSVDYAVRICENIQAVYGSVRYEIKEGT